MCADAVDGILVVDKPAGLTSSDACLRVKRMFQLKKAGHLGTLDPLATGVLPLCVNEGTKLVPFLSNCDKEYIATMRLGIETDTQDSQGAVVQQAGHAGCTPRDITAVLKGFCGEQQQKPPMYSAVKRNGVPLYKIARKGGWVERRPRRILIHEIDVIDVSLPLVTFRAVCSPGTYIRTLCHDAGRQLGCGAHLTGLQRVRNGAFHLNDSVSLDDCAARCREEVFEQHLIPSRDALAGMPEVRVGEQQARRVRNGVRISVEEAGTTCELRLHDGQVVKIVTETGCMAAVAEVNSDATARPPRQSLKILRVFL